MQGAAAGLRRDRCEQQGLDAWWGTCLRATTVHCLSDYGISMQIEKRGSISSGLTVTACDNV